MKSMNLFDRKGESSETLFGDSKPKETTNQLPSAPIQDKEGNLTFELERKTYSLNVYSEEERERVKEEVNSISLTQYDWFKEETGENHWVFYNTKMYEAERVNFLHYRSDCDLVPEIPINATSCYLMFSGCASLTRLDLNNFNTFNITTMRSMFFNCSALTQLDLSSFNTSKVIDMSSMFSCCSSLTQLDLSNFNTSNVIYMNWIFYYCRALTEIDISSFDTSNVISMCQMFCDCSSLTQLDISSFNTSRVTEMNHMFSLCKRLINIYISDKWNTDKEEYSSILFYYCYSLPYFNEKKTDIKMAKPVEQGGYLTLKK